MKSFSVGTDIVEIARIKRSCRLESFVRKVYSRQERDLFSLKKDPYSSMAGNWAAKEAFSKSLGTGVRGFELSEVSILRDELGCPYMVLSGKAAQIAQERELDFSVSISHEKEYATAVVIAFRRDKNE